MKKVEFPREIKEKMMDHQESQGNPRDWSVFEITSNANAEEGGFDWDQTPEGEYFWLEVSRGLFGRFFKLYPNQEPSAEPKYGDWILVRSNPKTRWLRRRFIAIREEKAVCWNGSMKNNDEGCIGTIAWPYWATKKILTKQEIADKFGLDVNQIEIEQ